MTATDDELRDSLINDLEQLKETFEYPDLGRAFQHWVADTVLGLPDSDIEDELNGTLSSDHGIDYFNVDEDGHVVKIIQAKFSKDFEASIPRGEIDAFFQILDKLEHNLGRGHFEERHKLYIDAKNRGFDVKLYIIVAGKLTDDNRQVIALAENKLPANVTFELLEREYLLGLVGKRNSRTCTIKLVDGESFINAQSGDQVEKVVASVSAKELKNIYELIPPTTLFSINPRHFLGGTISKGIDKTLHDDPQKIWHYNNGVSAVCDHFSYDRESNTLTVENLKIVNGCQTVTTIAKHKGIISDDTTLLMRISKVKDPDFLQKISTYTNAQNAIHSSDQWSNHTSLTKLEKKFESYRGKFFWEKKKGSFNFLEREEQRQYRKNKLGKLRVINNVTAARLKMAFQLELPHMSIKVGEKTIFSDDTVDTPNGHIRLFFELYEHADPKDFIIPNIFWYLLNRLKKKTDKTTSHGMLLHVQIGRYYIMSVIGKLLRDATHYNFENKIMNSVESDLVLDKLEDKIERLTKGLTVALETVLSNNEEHLKDYAPTGLRDKLKSDRFLQLYRQRQKDMNVHGHRQDLFIQDLEELLG